MLLVLLTKMSPVSRETPLEQLTDDRLSEIKKRMLFGGDWRRTPVESGQINGLTFQRFGWLGSLANVPRKVHGFIYTARDGDVFLAFLFSAPSRAMPTPWASATPR